MTTTTTTTTEEVKTMHVTINDLSLEGRKPTIKDLATLTRVFYYGIDNEVEIIELVRKTAPMSYCVQLAIQIADPSRQVDLTLAIDCIQDHLNEWCVGFVGIGLELLKEIPRHNAKEKIGMDWRAALVERGSARSMLSYNDPDAVQLRHFMKAHSYLELSEKLEDLKSFC